MLSISLSFGLPSRQTTQVKIQHPELAQLLQKAYSAEKAAAFAYQGHAGSVKNREEKAAIRQIEIDEWNHRRKCLRSCGYTKSRSRGTTKYGFISSGK